MLTALLSHTAFREMLPISRFSRASSTEAGAWIYNGADLERAKIVWARDIPGLDIGPLLHHFNGRRVWLAEPDAAIPRLGPYPVDAKP
jgi:hypothetical protein